MFRESVDRDNSKYCSSWKAGRIDSISIYSIVAFYFIYGLYAKIETLHVYAKIETFSVQHFADQNCAISASIIPSENITHLVAGDGDKPVLQFKDGKSGENYKMENYRSFRSFDQNRHTCVPKHIPSRSYRARTLTTDSDAEFSSKRKRYNVDQTEPEVKPEVEPESVVIEIHTGDSIINQPSFQPTIMLSPDFELPNRKTNLDEDQLNNFFVGETDTQKMDFNTAWTEMLPGEELDHDNSYETRVLNKVVTEQTASSCEQLIEVCHEEVKTEPDDSTQPANCEYVVLSTEDELVKKELINNETDQSG